MMEDEGMLSETLRLLRVFHEMKQNELARLLDVSNSYISEIEKGNRTPSMEIIQRYSKLFKIPVSSIMFFSENLEEAKNGEAWSLNLKNAIAKKVISFLQLIENRAMVND